jgi:glycosyltransferase involved in cell wall biosynthesis
MSKQFLLFRGPVQTISGYGFHSRDLLKSLYDMDLFDIKIDSCNWGHTPMNALDEDTLFNNWVKSNIVTQIDRIPDIYVQVTVPNEFQRMGKYNIGITAGIETTICPKDWIDGCNRMDLIITTSQFSKTVLGGTTYNELDPQTQNVIKEYKVIKPIEVLFEGVDLNKYNDKYEYFDLDIQEDFAFLFVGHWLQGSIGQDRKDVGMLIKTFADAFKIQDNQPALVLKTSAATFSVKERESFRKRIQQIVSGIPNPPSIYLLFGELSDYEMNQLYNHPKIKSMVTFTKGEGFCRPLLEFTMTGKPVIAPNWSGHKDFLPFDRAILIGGSLENVHESSVNTFILKDSKWFTVNYEEATTAMKLVKKEYDRFLPKSELLKTENIENFSFDKMTEKFKTFLKPVIDAPKFVDLKLPKLEKIS